LNRSKKLATQLALALSLTTLFGASAFADRRPSNETRGRDRGRTYDRRSNDHSAERRRTENRNWDRGRTRRSESFRNNDHRGNSSRYRQPYFAHGRVSRYERFGGGYRVWLGGVPHPFFIPEVHFRRFPRFSIGLDIRLGGYYNPRGYYDYYDGGAYTSAGLRGQVESVDLRRGTLLVHDDVANRFVTVEMRDTGRRLDDIRLGDYIELSGDWTRTGVFIAHRLDSLDPQGGFYR
jgi:hypothetical protein